jgi:hypothetical protein
VAKGLKSSKSIVLQGKLSIFDREWSGKVPRLIKNKIAH